MSDETSENVAVESGSTIEPTTNELEPVAVAATENDPDKDNPIPEIVSVANVTSAPEGYALVCGVVSEDKSRLTLVYQQTGGERRARPLAPNVKGLNDRQLREMIVATCGLPQSASSLVSILWE